MYIFFCFYAFKFTPGKPICWATVTSIKATPEGGGLSPKEFRA